jgi:integrase
LCVREENPAIGIKAPDSAKKQTRGCLYPDEFLQLIECERIPLAARRVIVLAVFLQMRAGELSRIRCEDIDLEHEIIHVRRGWDSYRKKEKQPKNGTSRTFDIPPNLLPLLRAMVAERDGKGILTEVNPYRVSQRFSEYLDAAGLTRWELRTRTADHIPLVFHGLRATGATWLSRTETNLLKLRHTLGHRDQATTDRYIEASQVLGRNVGEVFAKLPDSLITGYRSGNRSDDAKMPSKHGTDSRYPVDDGAAAPNPAGIAN